MSVQREIKIFKRRARILGLTLPWQLSSWNQFFVNEKSFLKAAIKWIDQKAAGSPFPKIEDDVDKGLMKRGSQAISPFQQQSSWTKLEPAKPLIAEPYELSEILEHCM